MAHAGYTLDCLCACLDRQRGQAWPAFVYVAASVILSIGALIAAMHLVRALA